MNKNDIKLVAILLLISIIILVIFNLNKINGNIAKVYYENELILTIDLNNNNEYIVNGYNGEVKIKVLNKKLKVVEENSPLHICSKQGYISSSNENIVCLPNKIVIRIEAEDKLDTIAR